MAPDEIIDSFSDVNGISIQFKQQRVDIEYLHTHYVQLLNKYRNKWIVISNGKVIIAEDSPDVFMEALRQPQRKDGFVYYLADPEDKLLLQGAHDRVNDPLVCSNPAQHRTF